MHTERMICFHRRVMRSFLLASLLAVTAAAQQPRPHVVVISLDAFAFESLKNPDLPAPTLHRLMQQGAWAQMQPINPTVTWPNHSAMVTGQNDSHFNLIVNAVIRGQRGDAMPKQDSNAAKQEMVPVPTVYELAHQAGMTTSEIDWVAIKRSGAIDFAFAEDPEPASPVVQEMLHSRLITQEQLGHWNKTSQAQRDRFYTAAAVHILKQHHPNLMLFHLLALDSIEHQTGYGNNSGINTIAFLDDRVKELVEAVREAGDLPNTTFLVVSDHGQQSTHHMLHPNALLTAQGLQQGAQAVFAIPDGGFAAIYQKNATQESIAKLKTLFASQAGIRAALTPDEAAKDGWPTPQQSDQAPDLLLYAANDYAFAGGNDGPFVTDTKEVGQHGYPNTEPLMQAIFIAAGNGIKPAGQLEPIRNLSVAPTIAKLLGLRLENVEGTPLTQILK